jgi:hypothetical protein
MEDAQATALAVVQAPSQSPDGRTDEAIGAVSLAGLGGARRLT